MRRLIPVVLALVLAGCAPAQPPAQLATIPDGAVCVPPGVPADFMAWPVGDVAKVMLRVDNDTIAPGIAVIYVARDGRLVQAVWVRGALVAVDANPRDPTAPSWIDAGYVNRGGENLLRATPGAPCQWRRGGPEHSA